MLKPKKSIIDSLEDILKIAREKDLLSFRIILYSLAERGYPALLIILSIPFCFPINIPGFSTPFGLLLAWIGLRIAWGKRPWWPLWILDKEIPSKTVIKWVEKGISVVKFLRKALYPRLTVFAANPLFHRLSGLFIFFLALLLSLPLPIPLTNIFAAVPILLFGLGMLEDDGLAILFAYILSLICFAIFIILFEFGKALFYSL